MSTYRLKGDHACGVIGKAPGVPPSALRGKGRLVRSTTLQAASSRIDPRIASDGPLVLPVPLRRVPKRLGQLICPPHGQPHVDGRHVTDETPPELVLSHGSVLAA